MAARRWSPVPSAGMTATSWFSFLSAGSFFSISDRSFAHDPAFELHGTIFGFQLYRRRPLPTSTLQTANEHLTRQRVEQWRKPTAGGSLQGVDLAATAEPARVVAKLTKRVELLQTEIAMTRGRNAESLARRQQKAENEKEALARRITELDRSPTAQLERRAIVAEQAAACTNRLKGRAVEEKDRLQALASQQASRLQALADALNAKNQALQLKEGECRTVKEELHKEQAEMNAKLEDQLMVAENSAMLYQLVGSALKERKRLDCDVKRLQALASEQKATKVEAVGEPMKKLVEPPMGYKERVTGAEEEAVGVPAKEDCSAHNRGGAKQASTAEKFVFKASCSSARGVSSSLRRDRLLVKGGLNDGGCSTALSRRTAIVSPSMHPHPVSFPKKDNSVPSGANVPHVFRRPCQVAKP